MADPISLSTVYEKLVQPIPDRPFSSLLFYLALLGAGYFVVTNKLIPDQWQSWLLGLLFVVLICVILALLRILVARNRPSRLTNPSVLEAVKQSFVGRDEDAQNLASLIFGSSQIWLDGDSGVGKSLLIQKAIMPALKAENVDAVYVNNWRGDWELTPAHTILDQLKLPYGDDPIESLQEALAATPRRVIILDQFDEYQIEHRDRFISEHGQVITRAQLESVNRFIRTLNFAVQQNSVRCVLVSRHDVEWGKRGVLSDDAVEFYLRRLGRNVVEAEIARIVPRNAVEHPENGWDGLRDVLCDDLAADGVLPVQMKFAVLGLDKLKHNLTRSAYERNGRVAGLVSRYIESEVRRIAGDRTLAQLVFPLLERIVTPDAKATVALPEGELIEPVEEKYRTAIMRVLEALKGSDIVRPVLSQDGNLMWRLDHDYLAGPVREISRRQLPEQWELKERLQQYLNAESWKKLWNLGGPWTILRLGRARLFKGLRFGGAASWYLFSIAASLLFLALMTYAVPRGYQWLADRARGRYLFSKITTRPEDIGPFQLRTTQDSDAKVLLQLMGSPIAAKQAFLVTCLESGENASRLVAHKFGLAIALSQTNSAVANRLYQTAIRPSLLDPQSDAVMLEGAFDLIRFWGTTLSLSDRETQNLATALAEHLSQLEHEDTASSLAFGLSALADRIDPMSVQKLATIMVEHMNEYPHEHPRLVLASGLRALENKIDSSTAQKLASVMVDRMSQESMSYRETEPELLVFAGGLGTLKDKIDPATAQKLATVLVERMSQNNDADELSALAKGLGALTDKAAPQTVQTAATLLVEHMRQQTYARGIKKLAEGLAALTDKATPQTVQTAATWLVERMNQENNAFELRDLAEGLGPLTDKASPQIVQTAATVLVEHMRQETREDWLRTLSGGLAALMDKTSPQIVQTATTVLMERISQEKAAYRLNQFAQGLGALIDKAPPQTVQTAATVLVEHMRQENDATPLSELAEGLGALKGKIDPATAQKLANVLVDRMSQEKDRAVLGILAEGLRGLPGADLTQKQLPPVSAAFQLQGAPCAALLAFDRATQENQLPKQLRNPLCREVDWKQLTVRAAQLSGRPVAKERVRAGEEIVVDFTKLSDYVWPGERWNYRAPSSPEIPAFVLFLLATLAFVLGLIKSRDQRIP
jgi:hypothetical protein